MAHTLVKTFNSDDGEMNENPQWHWFQEFGDARRTLCSGEAFGPGESHVEYELKTLQKGGITCTQCLKIIKIIKAIKL
jgi:hypothetical protein